MSNELKNKLMHYEAEPPPGNWDVIAEALESGKGSLFAQKLSAFEKDPRPGIWEKIDNGLHETRRPARIISFYTRYRRPLKYAAATAAFVIFAVLISLLISKKTESEISARRSITNSPPD